MIQKHSIISSHPFPPLSLFISAPYHIHSMRRRRGGHDSRFGVNFGQKLFGNGMFLIIIIVRCSGDLHVHRGHVRAVNVRIGLICAAAQDDLRRFRFVDGERRDLSIFLNHHHHRLAIHHFHRRHHVLDEHTHFHARINGDRLHFSRDLHRHLIAHRDEDIALQIGLIQRDQPRLGLIVLHHPPTAKELGGRIAELLPPLFNRSLIHFSKQRVHSSSTTLLLGLLRLLRLLFLIAFRRRRRRRRCPFGLGRIAQRSSFGVPRQSRALEVLFNVFTQSLAQRLHLLNPLLDLRRLAVLQDAVQVEVDGLSLLLHVLFGQTLRGRHGDPRDGHDRFVHRLVMVTVPLRVFAFIPHIIQSADGVHSRFQKRHHLLGSGLLAVWCTFDHRQCVLISGHQMIRSLVETAFLGGFTSFLHLLVHQRFVIGHPHWDIIVVVASSATAHFGSDSLEASGHGFQTRYDFRGHD